MKKYRERVGAQVSKGNFYRELQRLVEVGLAQTADRSVDGDPRRSPYRITDAGRDAFLRWFGDLSGMIVGSQHDDEISARLAFLADVPADVARAMLDQLQDALWMHAKLLERGRDQAAANAAGTARGLAVFPMIMDRRVRHCATEIAFLNDLRESYDAWVDRERRDGVETGAVSPHVVPRARAERRRDRR